MEKDYHMDIARNMQRTNQLSKRICTIPSIGLEHLCFCSSLLAFTRFFVWLSPTIHRPRRDSEIARDSALPSCAERRQRRSGVLPPGEQEQNV